MSLMGGYALYAIHAATLIHPTLLTTTYDFYVALSLSSRKHVLAFIVGICCIIYSSTRKKLDQLYLPKSRLFINRFCNLSFAINT
ncbi:uncharacterized protein N7500_005981 [Penicillium coprophilum]|uniref:uncharacterized protein n=1 Tax=Penicillium coprophilum TaxID=36646 RepID=UPI002382CD95|nr:uncharacterized protein N7500_005981 [Penicillium coprophilum]KAJ5164151.1 hypothetical protein N7500_005981 [Penicillium coprophilum]